MGIIDSSKDLFESVWSRVSGRVLLSNVLLVEEQIARWLSIYRGKSPWLMYDFATVSGHKHTRQRKAMNMAKVICRELAGLVWSENPVIDAGEKAPLTDWLEDQDFFNRAQKFTEYGAAAGGFVLKLRSPKPGELVVDFVPADYFIPISWNNQGIYEADFISRGVKDKKCYLTIESHRKISDSQYEITITEWEENGRYLSNKKELPAVLVNSDCPLFAYIPTPDVNNFDIDSPLGVSIFGNAEDTLESLDVAFDALSHEIILGKRRIIVPATALRSVLDPKTGKDVRYYDPSDEAIIAFNVKDAENQKIIDNTVELRIDEISKAVSVLLDILAMQTGFSAGTFSFDGQVMKTATEVISENAKSFKTKQSYENQLTHGMLALFDALREIGEGYGLGGISESITITWNDSIIEDRNSKGKYWNDRFLNGTCSLEDVLINVDGMTPEEAAVKAAQIKAGKATVNVGKLFDMGGTMPPDKMPKDKMKGKEE
jgi:A118 family predicted phage portal protein